MKHQTFKYAFKETLPIMIGFAFLGMTYGIYMQQMGFNFLYPTLMAMTIFGGSVEFVIANFLTKAFNPWLVFMIAFIISSRHIFYGISMLERYEGTGWRKPLLIFGLCDETFSINYVAKLPDNVNHQNFMLYVTMLNYIYWVGGAFLGGIMGSFIQLDLKGLGFSMTALFIVIFMNQFMHETSHFSSLSGLVIAILMVYIFGGTMFMPASMLLMIVILYVKSKREAAS
ncbi:AzlC family ABC transporter permease [Weissella viridescens]|uniref:AzlC family ABC transporter permease n=1 Tax=Weissella viridescens TaxID=1629 RepID=UPI001745F6C8|nr:AzlC family ABC transporter permease [Weissella viridescens]QOD86342.1 AzlC family ABC transporter permease [Weissella viridescens]WJI91471.1 AzlC family ABC transporter permease [Weissella viridescens]